MRDGYNRDKRRTRSGTAWSSVRTGRAPAIGCGSWRFPLRRTQWTTSDSTNSPGCSHRDTTGGRCCAAYWGSAEERWPARRPALGPMRPDVDIRDRNFQPLPRAPVVFVAIPATTARQTRLVSRMNASPSARPRRSIAHAEVVLCWVEPVWNSAPRSSVGSARARPLASSSMAPAGSARTIRNASTRVDPRKTRYDFRSCLACWRITIPANHSGSATGNLSTPKSTPGLSLLGS